MRIELLHVPDCPNVAEARRLLESCLRDLRIDAGIEQRETEWPSPTILIDGEDVMGAPQSIEPSCRLDVPTRERVLTGLKRAVN